MKKFFSILVYLTILTLFLSKAHAGSEVFTLCPLCNKEGTITCPEGFEAACPSDNDSSSEPKCILYNNNFISGCWKFVGINKLDFNIPLAKLLPSAMVEIIGGGETYTLNRETIGCRRIEGLEIRELKD